MDNIRTILKIINTIYNSTSCDYYSMVPGSRFNPFQYARHTQRYCKDSA